MEGNWGMSLQDTIGLKTENWKRNEKLISLIPYNNVHNTPMINIIFVLLDQQDGYLN